LQRREPDCLPGSRAFAGAIPHLFSKENIMKLQHIELSQLKISPANVRRHGAAEELDALIASIRSLGVIQPLLVRPNCEGFEVVAGQRRLLACQALHAETGKAEPVPCAVMKEGDDAAALEASLAENVARLPMDELDQYAAFAALKAQGRSVADIAGQFGVTELMVNRRLAIAALIPAVLDAYRQDDIEPQTLQQLADIYLWAAAQTGARHFWQDCR
jgi:ParB family chromosome partitioning protein